MVLRVPFHQRGFGELGEVYRVRDRVTATLRERAVERGEVSRVRTVLDIESYVDSGLFSGLFAKSEIRELLDEIYGSLD